MYFQYLKKQGSLLQRWGLQYGFLISLSHLLIIIRFDIQPTTLLLPEMPLPGGASSSHRSTTTTGFHSLSPFPEDIWSGKHFVLPDF